MAKQQTGVVKFFNEQKGYGFIKPDQGGRDIFVHISKLAETGIDALRENERVAFDTEPSNKKGKAPSAVNILILQGEEKVSCSQRS